MATRTRLFTCGILLLTIGCGEVPVSAPPHLELTTISDLNSADGIVEVNLVAAQGKTHFGDTGAAAIWGYADGARDPLQALVPGPLIDAQLGDTVIVHFTNLLPEGTTIHWHGVRVPNASDGSHVTQHEIGPGETFEYQFVAVDAGTFWYHPHVRSDVQIERGLAGALIVHGGPTIPVEADRVFVLDDVKLGSNGSLSEETTAEDLMLGRQGNVILANGRSGGQITVKNGARERWRFINAANGRYFNLRLPERSLLVVGWDGGVLAEPYWADSVLIAPGERYEVLVNLIGKAGEVIPVETIYYFRAHGLPFTDPEPVFTVRIGEDSASPGELPAVWSDFEDLPVDANTPVRAFLLEEGEPEMQGQDPQFFINGESFPDIPSIAGTSGDIEIWEFQNQSEMDHPMHLHGMFFQPLEVEGGLPLAHGWKDTVNVKSHNRVRAAVRFGEPGRWMYHCHILEHIERGMMGELTLTEAP
jgi:FtsP/CotA-like multicopper oxidase with cupredoxin domain